MTRLALLAGSLVLVAATQGGGGSQRAVREALARSPRTYLHYGRRWWGAPPRVTIRRLEVQGDQATAVLAARSSHLPQTVTLRRQGGHWRVATASLAYLVGPRQARPPTAPERAAIVAEERGRSVGPASCVTDTILVSRLDQRYALVDFHFPHPSDPSCRIFPGNSVYRRGPNGWSVISAPGVGHECTAAPAGVIRSLDGGCVLPTG